MPNQSGKCYYNLKFGLDQQDSEKISICVNSEKKLHWGCDDVSSS